MRGTVRAELGPRKGSRRCTSSCAPARACKSPIFSDTITLDRSGPEVEGVAVTLREGSMGSGPANVPVAVTWTARDDVAGLSDAVVSVTCGPDQAQRIEAPGSAGPAESVAWDAPAALFPDARCDVTAISKDGVGNTTRESVTDLITAIVPATSGAATVQGRQVGVIAQRGPEAGRAAVMLDGEGVALVDLYAPVSTGPEVVIRCWTSSRA